MIIISRCIVCIRLRAVGFTKSLAKEVATFRGNSVTVNMIAPGFIETEMTSKSTSPNILMRRYYLLRKRIFYKTG